MNKFFPSFLFVFSWCFYASAQKTGMISSGTAITVFNASQVAAIKKDTLVIITGSTRLFTVDTPEDQGLVVTKPGMQEILKQIKAKDGSTQQYYFTGKDGAKKDNGEIYALRAYIQKLCAMLSK